MSKEPNRNVYVGHRYVPLILEEWDKKISYEGLSVVTHKGNSYTSKKRVPVGIDILNKEFWSMTGNYNAQVDYYRQETERVSEKLDTKSDLLYVDTELDKKSDQTYVDTELGKKSDKTYVNTELDKKSNLTYVDTELDKKSDKTYVDTELNKKSDKTYVNTELDKKSDKSYVKQITNITPINTFSNVADGINNFYQPLPQDSTISFPRGEINIDKPLVFDRKIHINSIGTKFIYSGVVDKPAITIGHLSDIRQINVDDIHVIKKQQSTMRNNNKEIGIRLLNLRYSKITFSAENFYNNIVIDSSNGKGNVYNNYFISFVYDGVNNLVIRTSDVNSWSNENNFYGGSLAFSSGVGSADKSNVTVEHNGYRNNNNRFYGVSFEDAAGLSYAMKLDGGSHYFYGCRYEGSRNILLGDNAIDNVIMHGFGVPSMENVSGKEAGLSIIGNRGQHIEISSQESFNIDEKSSGNNKTLKVSYLGNEAFSVNGRGDIEGESLKIRNTINYNNGRALIMGRGTPENNVTALVGTLYIDDSGGGLYYKRFRNDDPTGWHKIVTETAEG